MKKNSAMAGLVAPARVAADNRRRGGLLSPSPPGTRCEGEQLWDGKDKRPIERLVTPASSSSLAGSILAPRSFSRKLARMTASMKTVVFAPPVAPSVSAAMIAAV